MTKKDAQLIIKCKEASTQYYLLSVVKNGFDKVLKYWAADCTDVSIESFTEYFRLCISIYDGTPISTTIPKYLVPKDTLNLVPKDTLNIVLTYLLVGKEVPRKYLVCSDRHPESHNRKFNAIVNDVIKRNLINDLIIV